jgi:alpha-D-ribose 1-methylphosphonate 5-triphosphate synthase subunit PhnL
MTTPLLTLQGVSKRFTLHHQNAAQLRVLDQVDLDLHPGECLVLDGPSGMGKSTLLKLVYANYRASSGTITLRQDDGARWTSPGHAARAGDHAPRQRRLREPVPARDSARAGAGRGGRAAAGRGHTVGRTGRGRAAGSRAWLTRLRIPERLWPLPPATFSGGEQQRINIARSLIKPRPLLLLDEPTASLDAGQHPHRDRTDPGSGRPRRRADGHLPRPRGGRCRGHPPHRHGASPASGVLHDPHRVPQRPPRAGRRSGRGQPRGRRRHHRLHRPRPPPGRGRPRPGRRLPAARPGRDPHRQLRAPPDAAPQGAVGRAARAAGARRRGGRRRHHHRVRRAGRGRCRPRQPARQHLARRGRHHRHLRPRRPAARRPPPARALRTAGAQHHRPVRALPRPRAPVADLADGPHARPAPVGEHRAGPHLLHRQEGLERREVPAPGGARRRAAGALRRPAPRLLRGLLPRPRHCHGQPRRHHRGACGAGARRRRQRVRVSDHRGGGARGARSAAC